MLASAVWTPVELFRVLAQDDVIIATCLLENLSVPNSCKEIALLQQLGCAMQAVSTGGEFSGFFKIARDSPYLCSRYSLEIEGALMAIEDKRAVEGVSGLA